MIPQEVCARAGFDPKKIVKYVVPSRGGKARRSGANR